MADTVFIEEEEDTQPSLGLFVSLETKHAKTQSQCEKSRHPF
jgi:hypothetical protein